MVRPPGRALATAAVGFLALDALLLAYAGIATGRWGLLAAAAACVVGSVVVIVAWRRFRRVIGEVAAARRAMRAEVESIRDLLHSHHLNN